MGRNKKDATQDVLNLYNQMQEDENIESGKDEIKVTLEEIESAKEVLNKGGTGQCLSKVGINKNSSCCCPREYGQHRWRSLQCHCQGRAKQPQSWYQ